LDVFPRELNAYASTKIVTYTDEVSLNLDYERERLSDKTINVIGPDENGEYLECKINPKYIIAQNGEYEKYNDTLTNFENEKNLDTEKSYLIKGSDNNKIYYYIYYYDSSEEVKKWVKDEENSFYKFLYTKPYDINVYINNISSS
jgi:hypothetical protein